MKLWSKLKALFAKRRLEREMATEMQAHLNGLTERNIAKGMSPEEAHYAAQRAFGGLEQVKETARDQRSFLWLDQAIHDVRYALRQFRRNLGFSLGVVLLLALAIGANTSQFALTRSVLLKPLPWQHADRLVYVYNTCDSIGWPLGPVSVPDYLDRSDKTDCFATAALFKSGFFNFSSGLSPEQVLGLQVTPSFFSTLGVAPAQGRPFTVEEATPGRDKVAIISYSLWHAQFGGRDDALASDLRLDGETCRIIGIMPEGFLSPNIGLFGVSNINAQIWIPFVQTQAEMSDQGRGNWSSWMIAKLKPGVSVAQAQEQVDIVQRRNDARFNSKYVPRQEGGFGGVVVGYREQNVRQIRPTLLILQAAVGIILLIACANIGNLMLARTISRKRELATRMALGCGRWRLARQLFTESLVLVGIGGALGVLFGAWSLELVRWLAGENLPFSQIIAFDRATIGFALLLVLGAGLIFGLIPLISLRQHHTLGALREGDARGSAGRSTGMMRSALIVIEVALALMLLIASGLTLRSLQNLRNVPLGFTSDQILTAKLTLPINEYQDDSARSAFFAEALEHIRTLPGVKSAGVITHLPFGGGFNTNNYMVKDETSTKSGPSRNAHIEVVDPAYFQTMQIPLLHGRFFSAADTAEAVPAVIIDRLLAQRCFPDRDPIGQQIKSPDGTTSGNQWCTVVGVVEEVKTASLAKEVVKETIYFPLAQRSGSKWTPVMAFVVRSKIDPATLTTSLRKVILQIDPTLPIYDVHTMNKRITDSLSEYRSPTILLVAFGAAALILAIVGLYAVLAYLVKQRTREIGIRIALGAQVQAILTLIVGQGLKLSLIGLIVGLAASLGLSRFLQSLLFGVKGTDPLTYLMVTGLLVAVSAVACYLPALAATKVDPAITLRAE